MKNCGIDPQRPAPEYSTFAWPLFKGSAIRPIWTGQGFDVGGTHCNVLCYDQHESHWSPALTALHEADAGRDHPIDLASRRMAIRSLRRFGTRPDPLLLDVGWSSGFLLEQLRMEWPEARLIGSDYLPEPLHDLASRLPEVPILQFDLTTCPLPDACMDGVTALNVLEHIKDDMQALIQIRRILKPGGVVHVEVPSNPDLYDILQGTHLGFFVYPLFATIKHRNRDKITWSAERKQTWISSQIRKTRRSPGLQLVLALELGLGRWFSYPVGIRCVVVGRRAP